MLALFLALAPVDEAWAVGQQLPSLSKMREIGALELPGEEAFGEISDLAVRSDGTIFILDGMSQEIKAFRGRFFGLLGTTRQGTG